MKILLTEDDPVSMRLMVRHLDQFELVTATDGNSAWELYQNDPEIRMAVLDWMVPELSGVDVCRRIRSLEKDSKRLRTYILIVTAKAAKEDIVEGLSAGADDYITKPFNRSEFMARIDVGCRMIDLEDKLASQIVELEATIAHIQRLQGLLPICAYCKKIRDTANYWHQVEAYISEHTDVLFTHSICPECLKKHFPTVKIEAQEDADSGKSTDPSA